MADRPLRQAIVCLATDNLRRKDLLKILKFCRFGVELDVLLDNTEAHTSTHRLAMARQFNQIIRAGTVPALHYRSVTKTFYHDLYFLFSQNVSFNNNDLDKMWLIGPSLSHRQRARITSPVLFMGDDMFNSYTAFQSGDNGVYSDLHDCIKRLGPLSTKNDMFKSLERAFRQESAYFEGLFLVHSWTNRLFSAHTCSIVDNSEGFHLRVSHPTIRNNYRGLVCLLHFCRTFYFMERLIGGYLHSSRQSNRTARLMTDIFCSAGDIKFRDALLSNYPGRLTLKDVVNLFNDSPFCTVNLNYWAEDNIPLQFEVRYHQATLDADAIYNWVLFINLFYSSCIDEVAGIFRLIDNGQYADSLLRLASVGSSFMTPALRANKYVNDAMEQLLFERFVPCSRLRLYYAHTHSASNQEDLSLHPSTIFDKHGRQRVISLEIPSSLGVVIG